MRLYLLPISTRRTLLYCQRLDSAATAERQTLVDKAQEKVAKTWADWEKKDRGWQKTVVNYGNYALRRIPYEEWGLKSVPPLSKRRRDHEVHGRNKVEVVFPQSILATHRVTSMLQTLATEREALHKQRLIWCFIGMPITAPIAIIPVVPNLPFFYLAYRAWSHWRALAGGQHLQFLLKNNLLTMAPSRVVDDVYADQPHPLPSTPEPTTSPDAEKANHAGASAAARSPHPEGETLLLSQENGKKMTQALDLPQLEIELERAIWQVEQAIQKQNETLNAKGPSDEHTTKDLEDRKKSQ